MSLYAITPPQSQPGFDVATPEGWSTFYAQITDRAADCESPEAARLGNVVRATGAIGTLSWETGPDGFAVCDLDVDVTVTSPGEPATDHLRASGLRASGGCW